MYAFLTIFKKRHVFMPMRSEDLEPPGACREHPDRGGRRTSKKRWEILCAAAPNVQNRSGHRSEAVRTQGVHRNRSATCNHQDWYCITN